MQTLNCIYLVRRQWQSAILYELSNEKNSINDMIKNEKKTHDDLTYPILMLDTFGDYFPWT